ncbi:MAG: amidohydrolase family protein [Vicinamibacteria bacterium]
MRLDSHQHFWSYHPREYGWIGDRMGAIRRDFAPGDLKPLLRANGFDGAVTVQVRQSLEETESMLRLAGEHAFIRGVVGWVDLRSPNVRRDLERFRRHPRFVGVRHVVQDEGDPRFLLGEEFLRGVAVLADLDLAYDLLVYHRHLPAVFDFVSRFPEGRLVLDHMGKPDIAGGELEPWASWIRKLGRFENLYCKVSGMVTEASWGEGERWKVSDFTPYLDVVLQAFGPRRLLFGSDWPVCTLAASYEGVVEIVRDFIEPLASAEKERILGGAAVELYRLEEPPNES